MEHQTQSRTTPVPSRAPAAQPAARKADRGHPLLALQTTAGNRAVVGLLSALHRQDEPDGADQGASPLAAEQVLDAIRYYTSQRSRYTPDIVGQIREAVGVTPEGGVDEAMVQGVARWQRDEGAGDPPLVVDGKAGPRTLPRLFRSGLNVAAEAHAFGEAAQTEVIDRWNELTPQQRAAELVRLVNIRLQAADVPAVTPNATDTGANAGEFDFATWQMEIGIAALSDDQLTVAEAADIVDTIYHEARHAEQWFRMAQMWAGRGRTAAGIARDMSIPQRIAAEAVSRPLPAGSMQALVAEGWYESVYGGGSQHRERVLRELRRAGTAHDRAQERVDADDTPENRAALGAAEARFDRAHDAYRELPEENDAWGTGPLTGTGVTRGSPEPDEEADEPDTDSPASAPTGAAPGGGPTELGGLFTDLARVLGPAGGVPAAVGSGTSAGQGDR